MTEFYNRIHNLSQQQRNLLALRLNQQPASAAAGQDDAEVPASQHRTKRLVAYAVVDQAQPLTASDLRQFLDEKLPEYMVPAAYVFLDALPLNANGKVDRKALPEPNEVMPETEDTFVTPRTPVEETLAAIWAEVLGFDLVGVHDNFFEMGGDSILSIRIIARANRAGIRITPEQFFSNPTIAAFATVAGAASIIRTEQSLVTGSVPLTPIQHWFFVQHYTAPHRWSQAVLLESPGDLDAALVERAMQHLLLHHDALRLRFVQEASGWQQLHGESERTVSLTEVDVSTLPESEQSAAIDTMAAALSASIDLGHGTLVKAALFKLGVGNSSRLLIIIHHLAVDAVSWRILLEDLETAYRQLSRGESIELPPKTTSFKYWSETLSEYAQAEAMRSELDYWLDEHRRPDVRLPVDYPEARTANTVASAHTVSVTLSVEETETLLHEVPKAYHTQMNDILLTALGQALAQWTRTRTLMFRWEGHGREDIVDDVDVSRTVGCFTSFFPVVLTLGEASDPKALLITVKEQLRQIPNRGIGYGVLHYLRKDQEGVKKLRLLSQPEVSFNYLGQFDQATIESSLFRPVSEAAGLVRSPQDFRAFLLEVNALIIKGQLQINWTYSTNLHSQETIEHVTQGFMDALRALITHCQSPNAGGYTPSDFPLAGLDQKELSQLSDLIDQLDAS